MVILVREVEGRRDWLNVGPVNVALDTMLLISMSELGLSYPSLYPTYLVCGHAVNPLTPFVAMCSLSRTCLGRSTEVLPFC